MHIGIKNKFLIYFVLHSVFTIFAEILDTGKLNIILDNS